MRINLCLLALATSLMTGCSEDDSDSGFIGADPIDQSRDQQSGNIPGQTGRPVSSLGTGDLTVLGGNANANQAAFRQRFALGDPTQDQMADWQQYDARFTEYSDKELISSFRYALWLWYLRNMPPPTNNRTNNIV
jgi:hypothetical protein